MQDCNNFCLILQFLNYYKWGPSFLFWSNRKALSISRLLIKRLHFELQHMPICKAERKQQNGFSNVLVWLTEKTSRDFVEGFSNMIKKNNHIEISFYWFVKINSESHNQVSGQLLENDLQTQHTLLIKISHLFFWIIRLPYCCFCVMFIDKFQKCMSILLSDSLF